MLNVEDRKIIQATRDLLTDPEHFVTCVQAVDSNGDWADPESAAAVKWCVAGGIRKFLVARDGHDYADEGLIRILRMLDPVAKSLFPKATRVASYSSRRGQQHGRSRGAPARARRRARRGDRRQDH